MINLIFEPQESHLISWCKQETNDFKYLSIIHDLEGYKEATKNVGREICGDSNKLNEHFRSLEKYYIYGYLYNNNILQRLNPPFNNFYRYLDYFSNNKIVRASIQTILDLMNKSEPFSQDLIDVLKTLDQHWY